jgi:hypothetical protein
MPDNNTTPEQPEDFWLLDRILHGDAEPDDAALAQLLDAARGPASAEELSGEPAARAAFETHRPGTSRPAGQRAGTHSRSRRIPVISALKASKMAGAAAVGGIALASTLTAAYAGALPAGLQDFAHHTIGAQAADDDQGDDPGDTGDTGSDDPTEGDSPSPSPSTTGTSGAVGPDATGPAAFGLCTAWSHGGLATTSVAYKSLVTAAGDEAGIEAYCATVVHPGSTGTHPTGKPTSHPGGSPTSHPGGSPTSHPGGSPSTHPTGKPTSHPTH